MKWQKWHAAVAGAVALVFAILLLRRGGGEGATGTGSDVKNASGAADGRDRDRDPDELLANFAITTPNASWTKLQRGIGGAAGILPTTLPGVVVLLADLDVRLGAELDGTAPIYGAVTGDLGDPRFAVAIKLVDLRHARTVLLDAEAAPFAAKAARSAEGTMTFLVPKGAQAGAKSDEPRQALALAIATNGYLVLGRSTDDVVRLTPYLTRTLPQRVGARAGQASPSSATAAVIDLPGAALATRFRPALEAIWKDKREYLLAEDAKARAERGRAPDFGDPAAIVAGLDAVIGRRLAVFGDLAHARVSLDVGDDGLSVVASLTPGGATAHGWVDGMKVGDASAVLALPASSILAASTRDADEARAQQAADFEKGAIAALGPRLPDPTKLHAAIDALAAVRGESLAVAVNLFDPASLLLRVSVRDGDAASRAVHGLFELAASTPFKDVLRVRNVAFSTEDVPSLGKADVAMVNRQERDRDRAARVEEQAKAPPHEPPAPFDAAWIVRGDDHGPTLELSSSRRPAATLKAGVSPARTFTDEAALKAFFDGIGAEASTVILAQPLVLSQDGAFPPAPVGLAIGKHAGDAFVRLDVRDIVLRQAIRWQMGF